MMKAIGWDDLGIGTSKAVEERRFYGELKRLLQEHNVEYDVTSDVDHFYAQALSGKVDFATIDLLDVDQTERGGKLAIDLRARLASGKDSSFPIFLLTSVPESFKYADAHKHRIMVLEKGPPAVVAHQIRFQLLQIGRYVDSERVLIFARHTDKSLGGEPLTTTNLTAVREIVTHLGLDAREVVAEDFSIDILAKIRDEIQSAGKIVFLMTADEGIRGSEAIWLPRANVIIELGLALGVPGGDRKIILLQQEGAYLPSNVGNVIPITFKKDVTEIGDRIRRAIAR